MSVYVRIAEGVIAEVIDPAYMEDGGEIPIVHRFTPEFVSELIDVTGFDPTPSSGWLADKTGSAWSFTNPSDAYP